MTRLNSLNYSKGFLIDAEWMGGVSESENSFQSFVLNHLTGETVAYHEYPSLESALAALNGIDREWAFEATGSCGDGKCSGEKCGPERCKKGACSIYQPA